MEPARCIATDSEPRQAPGIVDIVAQLAWVWMESLRPAKPPKTAGKPICASFKWLVWGLELRAHILDPNEEPYTQQVRLDSGKIRKPQPLGPTQGGQQP